MPRMDSFVCARKHVRSTVDDPRPECTLYVGTEKLSDDGGYRTVLHVGEDLSIPLVGDAAHRYAIAVITLACQATHDAAIYNQWVFGFKAEPRMAYEVVIEGLRPDRPPGDTDIPAPLRMKPSVRVVEETGLAYGVIELLAPAAVADGSLDTASAYRHALNVLEGRAISDLDSAYGSYLTQAADAQHAESAVGELQMWVHTDVFEPEPTSKRLARELRIAGAPPEMVERAFNGFYDVWQSELVAPELQLVADLQAAGLHDMARRAADGEWEGTNAEADQWAASAQGKQNFADLFKGASRLTAPKTARKSTRHQGRKKRRR